MDSVYSTPPTLCATHRRQLKDSGISEDVARERGYRTAASRSDLPDAFKSYQRRAPALVVPTYSPDGDTRSHQIRPDNPRRDKKSKPVKYETPARTRIIIDVHPRMRDRVREGIEPLFITEGIKSADSLTSQDAPTIALVGVWMAQKDKKLLACWDHVPLHGRVVYIAFDADVMTKEGVQLALERLVRLLEERGADVRVVYLSDGDVDDHVAAGGTIKELKMMARRFDPQDVARFRLQRYPKLYLYIEALRKLWWEEAWKGLGGHTRRDLLKELTSAGARHGEVTDDGVRVRLSTRTLQLRAGIGSRTTVTKQLRKLEEMGYIRREEGGPADQAATYVLLIPHARVYQVDGKDEEKNFSSIPSHPDGTPLRAPRLRWTYVGCKEHRRRVKGTRKVRFVEVPARERKERLGKVRGAVLDALDRAGGSAPIRELCEVLHRKRPWDLRNRVLPMLQEAGIVTVSEDALVSLTPDWLEALEDERDRGEEIAIERRTRDAHRRQREAFHKRHEVKLTPHWTNNPEADGAIEDLRPADEPEPEKPEPEKPVPQKEQPRPEEEEAAQAREVERLVRHGMKRRFALEEVFDQVQLGRRDGPPARKSATTGRDWRSHSVACECDDCLIPEPRYAQPYRGRSSA